MGRFDETYGAVTGAYLLIKQFDISKISLTKYLFFTGKGKPIDEVSGLVVANLDPIQAATEYKESVVSPCKGRLYRDRLKIRNAENLEISTFSAELLASLRGFEPPAYRLGG